MMGFIEALEKQCNWVVCGVRRPVQLEGPNGVLVIQDRADPSDAKVFRAHALPQGVCENVVCAMKLLANLRTGGDNLVDTMFEGLQQQSRLNITDELRRCIEVDTHEAVQIGDQEKNSVAIKMVTPKFNKVIFQNVAVRKGVDELTLREGEKGTLSLLSTPPRWEPADG